MKKIFVLLSFCLVQICYGQIQSGKVTYKIDPPTVERLIDTASVDGPAEAKTYAINYINSHLKVVPYLELELLFTPYESILNTTNVMTNDNQLDLKGALGATNTTGVYYNNIQDNTSIHLRSLQGKSYLIESNFDTLEWEIHDETKEIQGYTCIKATTKIVEATKDFITTVWFAPDLPFSFGPKEFRGLPGLILAIDYNHYYFYADSIDLNTKSKEIKRPTKGKAISESEYFNKVEKLFRGMRSQK